jgi:hypothetical protein
MVEAIIVTPKIQMEVVWSPTHGNSDIMCISLQKGSRNSRFKDGIKELLKTKKNRWSEIN